jgi:hypothetical protein
MDNDKALQEQQRAKQELVQSAFKVAGYRQRDNPEIVEIRKRILVLRASLNDQMSVVKKIQDDLKTEETKMNEILKPFALEIMGVDADAKPR